MVTVTEANIIQCSLCTKLQACGFAGIFPFTHNSLGGRLVWSDRHAPEPAARRHAARPCQQRPRHLQPLPGPLQGEVQGALSTLPLLPPGLSVEYRAPAPPHCPSDEPHSPGRGRSLWTQVGCRGGPPHTTLGPAGAPRLQGVSHETQTSPACPP